MDTAQVKVEMLSRPDWYRRGFLVQATSREHRSVYQKEIIDALGERNIKCIQFYTDNIMVITMVDQDIRDFVLVLLKVDSVGHKPELRYVIEPVFPLPAVVELLITGILQGLAEDLLDIMPQKLTEFCSELMDLEVKIIQWNGITTNAGDLLVSGVTKDLLKTLQVIEDKTQVSFDTAVGNVSVRSVQPIKDMRDNVGEIKAIWMRKISIRRS